MQSKHGVLATKVGMTQIFLEDGVCVPVTVLKIEDNIVLQKKTAQKDGYNAIQVAYGSIREKNLNRPKSMFFAKHEVAAKRFIREFRLSKESLDSYTEKSPASLDWLCEGTSLDVSGISKGKGFAGVMKRHNFRGFTRTRGTHETFRGGGSIGQCEDPGKVMKGRKMAGHMGSERVTVKNVRIIRFMSEDGILCLRGAVPGGKGALIELRTSNRTPKIIGGVAGFVIDKGLKNPMKASKAAAKSKKPAGKK